MKHGIVMPTRDRFFRLEECLPHWVEQDMPIVLVTEPTQVRRHARFLAARGLHKSVKVVAQPIGGKGIGYARWYCVRVAKYMRLSSFIMADDDVYPAKDADVRPILRFTDKKYAMGCAGWMSNYGMWVPDGNKLAKEPNIVVPMTGGPDRIYSLNTELVLRAGNFYRRLTVLYENAEINMAGTRIGYFWFVHTGVPIKMLGKRNDEGGIVAQAGSLEKRLAREKSCHVAMWEKWPNFVSHPDKRYMCRWGEMIKAHMGKEAALAMKERQYWTDDDTPVYTRRKA